MRISNSFSEDEIKVMQMLCGAELLRPRSIIARSVPFASLLRKIQYMAGRARGQSIADELDAARRSS